MLQASQAHLVIQQWHQEAPDDYGDGAIQGTRLWWLSSLGLRVMTGLSAVEPQIKWIKSKEKFSQ